MIDIRLGIAKADIEIDRNCQKEIEDITKECKEAKENVRSLVEIVEKEFEIFGGYEVILHLENSMFTRKSASYKWKVLNALRTTFLESGYSYCWFSDPYDAEDCEEYICVRVEK